MSSNGSAFSQFKRATLMRACLCRIAHPRRGNHSLAGASHVLRRLHDGNFVCRQRHVDSEDATLSRHIADADITAVRSHRLSRDGEPETQARTVTASALAERLE